MRDLTKGSEAKQILLFSLPMLLGNVFQQLYNMVDSVVVGNYVGKQALAAVGQSFPILFVSIALVIGFGMASNVLIAQNRGAGNVERVRSIVDTTVIVMLSFAGIVAFLGILLAPYILTLIGTPADILPDAALYLRIIFAGTLPLFGYNGVSAIQRGLGDSKTPLYALMVSTLVNIILDIVFVVLFHWGVAGVGIATVIAQTVSLVWTLGYLRKQSPELRIRFRGIRGDKRIFGEILRIGFPSGIQQALVGAGMMALTSVVNRFGSNAAAAFAAAGKLDSFAVMPAMNISMAISTFTGQNLGAGKRDRVSRGLLSGTAIALAITLIISVNLYFFGDVFVSFFTRDSEVVRIGFEYLRIVSLAYSIQTIMFTVLGVIRGAGEALVPMVNTLLAMWVVRIPLAFFLAPRMGTTGIWWSIDAGFVVGASASVLYYLFGPWGRRDLTGKSITPPSSRQNETAETYDSAEP